MPVETHMPVISLLIKKKKKNSGKEKGATQIELGSDYSERK